MPTSDARRTIWFKDDTPPVGLANPTPENSPSHLTQSSLDRESNTRRDGKDRHERPLVRKILNRDPWTIYTHKALVHAGHEVSLAIRCDAPAKLVHIQISRTDLTLVERAVQKLSRFAHHGFLHLLDVLHHQSTCYLVWEPAEFALDRVLISRCRIQEDELGHIIRPIIEGIKFLCDNGLVLPGKDLAQEHIVITQEGQVKLYGVERCRPINPADINAASLRLADLRDIVDQLMRQNRPDYHWSNDVLNFATRLGEDYSDGHLERLLQHPLLQCQSGDGSLKLLVNLVNKTAYHRVVFRPLPAPLG
ncbi:hypothetical protein BJX63DRAFT_416161 [Aspergillus granulosus]|uniref:Protein kinase domain-containing protein n=1 Tax=Aspergillus granulosus TaxID=176169 RepID=A0ABR4GS89_9EURO